jgi:hypothetical protein
MAKLTASEMQTLGFEWPKHSIIEEYCAIEGDQVDLRRTLEKMLASRAFHQQQLNQAFNFKMQTGADYSDFTDRFDEHALMKRRLDTAITYLGEILDTVEGRTT